jgi:hypothetical protein
VTSITDEPVVGLIEMDIPLALGARQNIQEILADCHTLTSSKKTMLRYGDFDQIQNRGQR